MRVMATGVFCVAVAGTAFGQAQQGQVQLPRIEQLMSAQRFEAAGLRKLSPEELNALNEWLREYALSIAQLVTERSAGDTTVTPAVIESRIDGEFTGWEGETIFKLQNGQIWQQASYAYMYRYAYSPRVTIYRSGSGYKMKVERVDREISVRRIR